MRRFFLTFFFFTIALASTAQHTDIVKLTNSEVVRGTITENIRGVSITILALPDSNIRVIPYSDIETIIFKDGISRFEKSKEERQSLGEDYKHSGFRGYFRVGANTESVLKTDLILGGTFSNKFSIGLGLGARFGNKNFISVPVFVDLRWTPITQRVSPVVAVSAGGNFQRNDGLTMGKFISPETGIRIGEPYKTFFIFALGLEFFDYRSKDDGAGVFKYGGYTFSLIVGF